jgi:hypothetical protein
VEITVRFNLELTEHPCTKVLRVDRDGKYLAVPNVKHRVTKGKLNQKLDLGERKNQKR